MPVLSIAKERYRNVALRQTGVAARLRLGALLLLLAQVAGSGCWVVDDQFVCGKAQSDNAALARICDVPGQTCVCNTNRCGAPDKGCPSGLRYVFGDKDCVNSTDAPGIFQGDAAHGFCPGEAPAPPCGRPQGTACVSTQVCVCATEQCAAPEPGGDCQSGYAYAKDSSCVEPENVRPEQLLFPGDSAANGLCPQYQPAMRQCGVSVSGASPVPCDKGTVCVCASDRFQCAYRSSGCANGYAWKQDAGCVTDVAREIVESKSNQVDREGFCPGQGGSASLAGAGGEAGSSQSNAGGAAGN